MKQNLLQRVLLVAFGVVFSLSLFAQEKVTYADHKYDQGIQLAKESKGGVSVTFSINEFTFTDRDVNGETMKGIEIPGTFLPNDEGYPDLPGQSRFVMIPQGAEASVSIKNAVVETYQNVEISPAPRIPLDTEDGPLEFNKNMEVYNQNAFYPENPVQISEERNIRGVDMVMLGITPFQYNPVTKELKVYRDMEIEVSFEGGNGQFGEDRLRSRYWYPMVKDMALNSGSLEEMDYNKRILNRETKTNTDLEYIIISPDDPIFQAWAGVIKNYRTKQGIVTGVVTLSEIGGNNAATIENYINNAYNTWYVPPAAVLILGDYGSDQNVNVTSPMWDNYCVSDNIYADVDEDDLPDIVFARITARNEDELSLMINKFINYENNPPLSFDFYNNPITALGWQTERWFQICSETVGGFWKNELGKEPVRINEIYSGSPGSTWSTATNTSTVLNYFGPNGLGYIPATPAELGNWAGGNASMINNAINAGAFMLMHRDHGGETGWGEPDYGNSDILGLNNTDLTYILSINCLTGKYNWSSECFAEAFHRHQYGALGLIAASEVSYSFVNDTYVWGMMDNMWNEFMPDYGDEFPTNFIRPAFGSAAGKHFLESSSWPYNTSNKTVTYHLFHAHSGAFTTVYSEMPTQVAIEYSEVLPVAQEFFEFTGEEGAMVCLTYNDQIIGVAEANGTLQQMMIDPMSNPGDSVLVTVTARNKFRYEDYVLIAGAPFPTQNPNPADGDDGIAPFTKLKWTDGLGNLAETYKVYVGTDNPPTNIVNGEETTENIFTLPEDLDFESTYYWRIDSYNIYGSVEGNVWTFDTGTEADEDFETGDFSAWGWYSGGDADWSVVNSEAACGSYAAQTGEVGAMQSTSLFLDVNIDAFLPQVMTYWVKMDAASSSTMSFYVDGVYKMSTAGSMDWALCAPLVPPGQHTLEWRFATGEVSTGDEVAWIDFIHFPNLAGLSVSAGDNTTICEDDVYATQGAASSYAGLEWTTSGTGTFDDPADLHTTYIPSEDDYAAGMVTLTLDVWDEEENHLIDDMELAFMDAPGINAENGGICGSGPAMIDWVDVTNYSSVNWSTMGDGSFDDPSLLNPTYTAGAEDLANGSVELVMNIHGNAPCGTIDHSVMVAVESDPMIPTMPDGPDYVDLYYLSSTEYTTDGNTSVYNWVLEPAEAGDLTKDGSTAYISWNTEFEGTATLTVNGENGCGVSSYSDALEIIIDNTVGINDLDQFNTKVLPNPANGIFNVYFNAQGSYTLSVFNTLGERIYHSENNLTEEVRETVNLSNYSNGLYYLVIEGDNAKAVKKIIIDK
ncbi:MAG: hypothetical protein C0593_06065 [Marinilabiliales bacterium]|nr:MAG: hypothetical protein C0593_06065 [Marinilabiliales bacterium]